MLKFTKFLTIAVLFFAAFGAVSNATAQTLSTPGVAGKRPVILIPGITGSQLVNSETGETAWFRFAGGGSDDLRLPISPNLRQNRDSLVAKDILREVKLPGLLSVLPDIQVYGPAVNALKSGGYTESSWDDPADRDVFYVFAYDWRRDNVESARELIEKIEATKRRLNRPDLKFDIVAHSMGGLVARYAVMYGTADLPAGGRTPVPTFAGARHINRLVLVGTPNRGSLSAFSILTTGYTIGGRNLPFIDDLTKDDVFVIPSLFQLMPHRGTARFLDENLKPIDVDLYRPQTWSRYGWGAINDPKFLARLKDAAEIEGVEPIEARNFKTVDARELADTTYAEARAYFAAVLNRAARFQAALSVRTRQTPIEILYYGSDCDETLDAVVLVRNRKRDGWRTITQPSEFRTSKGEKVSKDAVRAAIYTSGDGRVPRYSLLAESSTANARNVKTGFQQNNVNAGFFACEPHHTLLSNQTIQNAFLAKLNFESADQSKVSPVLTGR